MAYLSFTQLSSLPSWHSNWEQSLYLNFVQLHHNGRWNIAAVSKKKIAETLSHEVPEGDAIVVEKAKRGRPRKKAISEDPANEETATSLDRNENTKKTRRHGRKKGSSSSVAEPISDNVEEEAVVKKVTGRRKAKKQIDSGIELNVQESDTFLEITDDDDDNVEELEIKIDDGDDISHTYRWPPLVCCFGAAQHGFIPSGRPANRTIDHEIHELRKDAMWAPEKFVRAPGGCSSNVAVAVSRLGGKVAFMGKLADDDFGQSILYYLNKNEVQTRSIKMDGKRVTAISQMKVGKRGNLKMTIVKSCAEDSLSKSEINLDVLKEAKMFYFNSFSLLGKKMRSTTMEAIKVSKKLGGVVFYDLNLPLPLWESCEETKKLIQEAWDLADIIEITQQELEFLCGIHASSDQQIENESSDYVHHSEEVIDSLWQENLKVLFVTNGTSDIHYYTKEHHGVVLGMEDPPVTPFTSEMSASGDGVVAGLLKMLTVQPHLVTDKEYIEHSIGYAMNCGLIDQWLHSQILGYPPKDWMEANVIPDCNGIKSITEKEYRSVPLVPS